MGTHEHAPTPASRHGAMARLGPRRSGGIVTHLRGREAVLIAGHDGRVEAVLRVGVAQAVERRVGVGTVAFHREELQRASKVHRVQPREGQPHPGAAAPQPPAVVHPHVSQLAARDAASFVRHLDDNLVSRDRYHDAHRRQLRLIRRGQGRLVALRRHRILLQRHAACVAQQLAHDEPQMLGHEHESLRAVTSVHLDRRRRARSHAALGGDRGGGGLA
mmetsp:Transcript_543/g.1292  ORF Transcript_543/g.1292 Transcript_543/m.1292 type:complete len:218 (+) Transcript_543:67-720(+)